MSTEDKKYILTKKSILSAASAILYLIIELAIVGASIWKAANEEWLAAIWFILAAGLSRFYYTVSTNKDSKP